MPRGINVTLTGGPRGGETLRVTEQAFDAGELHVTNPETWDLIRYRKVLGQTICTCGRHPGHTKIMWVYLLDLEL